MVAYSFKARFAPRILDGSKSQTIRADRHRHARPGEQLQLYTGMRTKHCRLLARATCIDVRPVMLVFDDDPEMEGVAMPGFGFPGGLDGFARADGFDSWAELKQFWRENHPGIDRFEGVLISWEALVAEIAPGSPPAPSDGPEHRSGAPDPRQPVQNPFNGQA